MLELGIGIVIGATACWWIMHSQMQILQGMLLDRHNIELRSKGVKSESSVIKEVQQIQTSEQPTQHPNTPARTDLMPPSIFASRQKAEAEEAEAFRRQKEMLNLVDSM